MFRCNICDSPSVVPLEAVDRETPSCAKCGSTLRFRGIVAALSLALYGRSLILSQMPVAKHIRGIGVSDWHGYAAPLAEHFDYTNTYYHTEPKLDLYAPLAPHWKASCDFIICSDVLEHVPPPPEVAMRTCLELLKPGGVLVMSVPYATEGHTVEHYPDLHRFELLEFEGAPILVNRRKDGRLEVFDQLVFHGGPGSTLEMRLFAIDDLLAGLRDVGFEQVEVFNRDVPEHGVVWHVPWSLPVVARAPTR